MVILGQAIPVCHLIGIKTMGISPLFLFPAGILIIEKIESIQFRHPAPPGTSHTMFPG
jgi:hypothetical protein